MSLVKRTSCCAHHAVPAMPCTRMLGGAPKLQAPPPPSPVLQAAEQSDDFRLNVAFMRACMDDKAQVGAGCCCTHQVHRSAAGYLFHAHAWMTRRRWVKLSTVQQAGLARH